MNRIVIGAALFALVYLANLLGPAPWALVVLVISLLAFQEFKVLCNNMGVYPLASWIHFFITIFILSPLLSINNFDLQEVFKTQVVILLTSYVVIFPSILLKTTYTKFEDLAASLLAIFHLGFLGSFFSWLRVMDGGFEYTLVAVLIVAATDIGSLVIGKLFGKQQIAPLVSPGKTVAGSLGGSLCGALLFFYLYKHFAFDFNLDLGVPTYMVVFLIGILISVLAQVGDLLVSALKRAAGVKDSGDLLQSHGGVLDRIDGHFFAIWLSFLVFSYIM